MKKLFSILLIVVSMLILSSCVSEETKTEYPIDLEVTIISEVTDEVNIIVNVLVPIELSNLDDLLEITLNIASQTYERHFNMIGSKQYTLRINLFKSISSLDQIPAYGYHEFLINASLTSPGLSLSTNGLKLG
jgi:hypothetical protein